MNNTYRSILAPALVVLLLPLACKPQNNETQNNETPNGGVQNHGVQVNEQDDAGVKAKTPGLSPPPTPGVGATDGKIKDAAIQDGSAVPGFAKGMDAQDLGAILGKQKVAAAEKRLRDLQKRGLLKVNGRLLSFKEISNWDYDEGLRGMPKSLNELNGKKVTMLGFMLPIDQIEDMKEFVLVESLWACCFGKPPDTNGMVRVVLQGKSRMDFTADPISVEGVFRISETIEEGFCVDIYQIEVSSVKPLQ